MLTNPGVVKDDIVEWIRAYFDTSGASYITVEMSNDQNSIITMLLCVEAIGSGKVIPVHTGDTEALDPAVLETLERVGLRSALYWVKSHKLKLAVADELRVFKDWSDNRLEVARKAEVLMLTCFSRIRNAVIASPRDMTGAFVGLCELHGDFAPLADFTAEEVTQIGEELLASGGLIGEDHIPYKDYMIGFTPYQVETYIGTGSSGNLEADIAIAAAHNACLKITKRTPQFYMPQTTDYDVWTDEMKHAYQIYMENRV